MYLIPISCTMGEIGFLMVFLDKKRESGDVPNSIALNYTYTLDSYWTADLKLEQRVFDRWLLSLQGNNLFNEEYDTYLDSFTDQGTGQTTVEGYPGAGRSFFFKATYRY